MTTNSKTRWHGSRTTTGHDAKKLFILSRYWNEKKMITKYEYKRWPESDSEEARERFLASCDNDNQWIVNRENWSGLSGARYLIVEVEDGRCARCKETKPIEDIWDLCRDCCARQGSCIKESYYKNAAAFRLRENPKLSRAIDADMEHERHGL